MTSPAFPPRARSSAECRLLRSAIKNYFLAPGFHFFARFRLIGSSKRCKRAKSRPTGTPTHSTTTGDERSAGIILLFVIPDYQLVSRVATTTTIPLPLSAPTASPCPPCANAVTPRFAVAIVVVTRRNSSATLLLTPGDYSSERADTAKPTRIDRAHTRTTATTTAKNRRHVRADDATGQKKKYFVTPALPTSNLNLLYPTDISSILKKFAVKRTISSHQLSLMY